MNVTLTAAIVLEYKVVIVCHVLQEDICLEQVVMHVMQIV